MQQIDSDVTIKFPFGFEYSLDNGNTWTSVEADTDTTITVDSLPSNKKIKIRSNDAAATTLVGASIDKENVSFEEVNIRNAGTITNMESFLQDSVVDRVFIQRCNAVENLHWVLKASVTNVFLCDPAPNCTNASSMFYFSSFGYVGDLILSSIGSTIDTRSIFSDSAGDVVSSLSVLGTSPSTTGVANEFRQCNIKAVGSVKLHCIGESDNNNFYQFLYGATIGKFPSMDLKTKMGYHFMYNGGLGIKSGSDYLPTVKIDMIGSGNNYFREALTNASSGSSTTFPVKFAGLDITHRVSGSGCMYGTNDTSIPFPTKGSLVARANLSGITSCAYTTGPISSILAKGNNSKRTYYEDLDWFPVCRYLRTETVTDLVGVKGAGFTLLKPAVYKVDGNNINMHTSERLGHLYETDVSYSTIKKTYTDVSNIAVSVQGYTARQEGDDIKVYDINDNLMSTVAGVTFNSANFSWDGLKLYVVTGGVLDRAGSEGQTITNTITVYETTSGNVLNTYNIANDADEYTVGVYQANDDYNLKIVKVKYANDADGNFVFNSTKVDSYNKAVTVVTDTEPVPDDVDFVCQDYIEANEFVLMDTTTGKVIRMVGK